MDQKISELQPVDRVLGTDSTVIERDGAAVSKRASVDQILDFILNNIPDYSYVTAIISSLQAQIDGQITSWFYDYIPSLENAPAVGWDQNDKDKHLGDLFYYKSKGYAYRFQKDTDTGAYTWQLLSDSDITLALQQAQKAQETADGKSSTFIVTPYTPYERGDLWTNTETGELLRCKTSRSIGDFVAADWEKATKYTDDTAANAAQQTATQAAAAAGDAKSIAEQAKTNAANAANAATAAQTTANTAIATLTDIASDSVLTPSEKQSTLKEWLLIQGEKPTIVLQANAYTVNHDDYDGKYNALSDYITPILSNLTTNSAIVGDVFRAYFTNYYNTKTTLLKAVSDKAKVLADGAQTAADAAKSAADNIQVGGRNYFLNGGTVYNMMLSTSPAVVRTDNFPLNTEMAISFEARVIAGDGRILHTEFWGGNRATWFSITTDWKRYTTVMSTLTSSVWYLWMNDLSANVEVRNIMIVKGNRPMDFSPAPEDVAADATEKANAAVSAAKAYADAQANAAAVSAKAYADGIIDAEEQRAIDDANAKLNEAKAHADQAAAAIQVGGRNLIRNSKLNYTSSGHFGSLPLSEQILVGKTYTISAKVKSATGGALQLIVKGPSWAYEECRFPVSAVYNNWTIVSRTFTSTRTDSMDFGVYIDGGTWSIEWLKLEAGNKATDWTPAPEDVQASIDAKSTAALQAAKDYAAAQDSLLKAQQEAYADGKVTAEEQARINDAQAKLNAAKAYADQVAINGEIYARGTGLNNNAAPIIKVNGLSLLNSYGRGHNMIRLSKTSLSVIEGPMTFDTYSTTDGIVSKLKSITSFDEIIILVTQDAAKVNNPLNAELIRFGSSGLISFDSDRRPHVFIGMLGLKQGQAFERVEDTGATSPYAEITVKVSNGQFVGVSSIEAISAANAAALAAAQAANNAIANAANAQTTANLVATKTNFLTTTQDGNVVATGTLIVGDAAGNNNAGITGVVDNAASSVRFWAGSNYAGRNTAPFRVQNDGKFFADNAEISGTIIASAGRIGQWQINSYGGMSNLYVNGVSQNAVIYNHLDFPSGGYQELLISNMSVFGNEARAPLALENYRVWNGKNIGIWMSVRGASDNTAIQIDFGDLNLTNGNIIANGNIISNGNIIANGNIIVGGSVGSTQTRRLKAEFDGYGFRWSQWVFKSGVLTNIIIENN